MVRTPDIDLSGKSEQARVVWTWSIVAICLHGKASGEPLMALRSSTINFLERGREAQSTWVLSDLWGQVKQKIPEGKLRIWATASPLPYHLANTREERPSP